MGVSFWNNRQGEPVVEQYDPQVLFWAMVTLVVVAVMAAANGKRGTAALFAILALFAWFGYDAAVAP
jgi:hypothetical protein